MPQMGSFELAVVVVIGIYPFSVFVVLVLLSDIWMTLHPPLNCRLGILGQIFGASRFNFLQVPPAASSPPDPEELASNQHAVHGATVVADTIGASQIEILTGGLTAPHAIDDEFEFIPSRAQWNGNSTRHSRHDRAPVPQDRSY